MTRRRSVFAALTAVCALGTGAVLLVGSELASPASSAVGLPPQALGLENVEFLSESGSLLKGWLSHRPTDHGVVILMHGIRANRSSMLSRAKFLKDAGYSVLLFDLQAHGESTGKHQGFGYLESMDAKAACDFVRAQIPGQRIGVIGTSLGGAAAILASPPLDVQAMVAEAVFPTIEEATSNRIAIRLGAAGRLLTPLLVGQLRFRLGVAPESLRPIERISGVRAPLFLIAGGADRDTTPDESKRLFQAAPDPKQYWELQGAGHVDFHIYAKAEYERRVLEFLSAYVRGQQRSTVN